MTRTAARRGALTRRMNRMTASEAFVALVVVLVVTQVWPTLALLAIATVAAYLAWNPSRQRRTRRINTRTRLYGLWRTRRPAAVRRRTTLDQFLACDPTEFEHAVAGLARREPDVASASVHGGADDRGLDVLVQLRTGRRVLVQCKRYAPSNRVGSEHVQIVNGTYRDVHRCDEAVIVTTSSYTASATALARQLARPVRLVDGNGLVAWSAGGPAPWR